MSDQDKAKALEAIGINKESVIAEKAKWGIEWQIDKFYTPNGESIEGMKPYESSVEKGNLLVNTGIQLLEDLLIGAGGTAFNNANSYIGTGSDGTAAAATQTDLLDGSAERIGMEATFPSRASQTLSFKSIFTTGDGNYEWLEIGVFNASTAGTMLNRKVVSKGTKEATDTWTITITITIS